MPSANVKYAIEMRVVTTRQQSVFSPVNLTTVLCFLHAKMHQRKEMKHVWNRGNSDCSLAAWSFSISYNYRLHSRCLGCGPDIPCAGFHETQQSKRIETLPHSRSAMARRKQCESASGLGKVAFVAPYFGRG